LKVKVSKMANRDQRAERTRLAKTRYSIGVPVDSERGLRQSKPLFADAAGAQLPR